MRKTALNRISCVISLLEEKKAVLREKMPGRGVLVRANGIQY
jgi:hypothetical protein